jgi:threonylcarbamoyladenosine tRNA methylthiotransferase MtaB
VIKQIEEAYEAGFREVVLTGIHLAHYGWDLGTDLMQLLKSIFQRKEIPRIRLSTLDPFEIPDELLELMKSEPRLCPHFHIAIQSGDDGVLKGMRRIYKASEFSDVSRKIESIPRDVFIGLDVIVGFPGEDKTAFETTEKLLRDTYWSKLHVFPFSARKGTRAETLPNPVSQSEKNSRSLQLRKLSDERYASFMSSQIGKTKEVIWERPLPNSVGIWTGHTENYLPVLAQGDFINKKTAPVRLTALKGNRLSAVSL